MSVLPFRTRQRLARLRLFNDIGRGVGFELGVDGYKHCFHAAEVWDRVFGETASQKGARGVAAGEDVVGAAGPVSSGGGRDIVDCAVEREVDGFCGVAAVVKCEFSVGEVDLALL